MLNLSLMLTDSARRLPGKAAVIEGERSMTYREVDEAANRVARLLLDKGLRPGDRVALTCPNVLEFPAVYFGILKAGAVVVPLNTMLKRGEVAYHLRDSGARAYFCLIGSPDDEAWRGFEDSASCAFLFVIDSTGATVPPGLPTLTEALRGRPADDVLVPTEATDTAVVLYTSGTTGRPKGAQLSHANVVMNALATHPLFEARQDDVHLVPLPLFHSFGQTVQLNAGFAVGSTLVLMARFGGRTALELMAEHHVTFFAGVPTMYWALLASAGADDPASDLAATLRVAVSGGAALSADTLSQFRDVFGVGIREGYGLSETSPTVAFNRLDRPSKPGSIGLPVWGVEVKLMAPDWSEVAAGQPGEIAVRGHNVMKGYLGRPEATAEVLRDGWFRTGDIATRDEEGYYFIVDRAKDLIVRGGFNVYPREVEEALMTHPSVSLVAVVGVPDDRVGEEVKAYVIRQPGSTVSEFELIAWCRERLAVYKCPRLVEFRETLPVNATGKILKRELR
ncbi:long-chain fatty acid--CoA ligase [Streptomyces malaysiensis subsp. malaysiensis]|uniref:Long-chain fatty acid--CoA ligase n=1 Tax=Streptomyces malaysiensis TaxID=92644 RepID=A0ABX6VVV9_STRMQ|nr:MULTISPECIES: long-chain fatty acid--CoA ligase [Streptomyces]QPI53590.1 long-chain fatty acid--CoA ligase [Streptomyces solisilvae]UHH14926.1 long-chain fatty acid--CoA ligase [Streptomyces sp. HNM0561]